MWLLTVMLDQSDQNALFKMTEFARDGCSAETLLLLGDASGTKSCRVFSPKSSPTKGIVDFGPRTLAK